MKTKKLSLKDLTVKSFVTTIEPSYQGKLLGGDPLGSKPFCSYDDGCITGGTGCGITNVYPFCR